jgi:hypothetical protein
MNSTNIRLASSLISDTYVKQASDARKQLEKQVTILLSQRRMPEEAWDDMSILSFLGELSQMDSNNFIGMCLLHVPARDQILIMVSQLFRCRKCGRRGA